MPVDEARNSLGYVYIYQTSSDLAFVSQQVKRSKVDVQIARRRTFWNTSFVSTNT